jgi:hypothetical protein
VTAELTTSIKAKSSFFFRFMATAHNTLMVLLAKLSDVMGLEGPKRFGAYHANTSPSLTNLALLRYPKHESAVVHSLGHNKQMDIWLLNFLLCQQWGIQILTPGTEKWSFVGLRAGHAVINVGGSLRFPVWVVVNRAIPVREK